MATNLHVDWCSYEAAKYAVMNWHYSKAMPVGKLVKVGAWEDGEFIGAILFSRGANQYLLTKYGLDQTEGCELTRVALSQHKGFTSQILSRAIKMLKKSNSGLRLIVSYADVDREHVGTLYQATNWIYEGLTQTDGGTPKYKINGNVMHGRSVHSRGWVQNIEWLRTHIDPNTEHVYTLGKHKYLYPLDKAMRRQIESLHKPYPKRAGG